MWMKWLLLESLERIMCEGHQYLGDSDQTKAYDCNKTNGVILF